MRLDACERLSVQVVMMIDTTKHFGVSLNDLDLHAKSGGKTKARTGAVIFFFGGGGGGRGGGVKSPEAAHTFAMTDYARGKTAKKSCDHSQY